MTTYININGQTIEPPADLPPRRFRDAWTYDGSVVAIDPVKQREIYIREVKAEAARRIEAAYPIYKQLNLQAEGGEAFVAMRAFIDAFRTRSDVLEQGTILDEITLRADATWTAS